METKEQTYYSSVIEINNLMPDYSKIELNVNNPTLSLDNNIPSNLNHLNIENNAIIIDDKYNNYNQNNNIELVYYDNVTNNNTINENIYLQPEINSNVFTNSIDANTLNNNSNNININNINILSYNNNNFKDKVLNNEVENKENKIFVNYLTPIEYNSNNLKEGNINSNNNNQIITTNILPAEEKSLKSDKQNVQVIAQNNSEIKEKAECEKNEPEKKKYKIKKQKKPKIKTTKKVCFCCCYSILWCLKFFSHG